jgi:hypothetical protein
MNRRAFLQAAAVAPSLHRVRLDEPGGTRPASSTERSFWIATMLRVAKPVLTNLANRTLRAKMPVEQSARADRRAVTHLEAVGRLLTGIAPWLEAPDVPASEAPLQTQFRKLAVDGLDAGLEPGSPDLLNFSRESQPLVDAAFLAQALLRAPTALADALGDKTRVRLAEAFESTRAIVPPFNNWLLFSATVEAALKRLGARWDRMRVDYALRQHEQWYKGDGAYGDGPSFHWDYYNSFVIHPMLLDVLDACADERPAWMELSPKMRERAQRYAAILERLVAPDGSFPIVGRSIAYRCGAFHLLAQLALKQQLPSGVSPAQARSALGAVIERTLGAPDTFDAEGWLTIGLAGHQPEIGESYISTGSLYLCAAAFLPLGLTTTAPFWSAAPEPWTSQRAFGGKPFPIDHALG